MAKLGPKYRKALLDYAISFPEAYEDHPWGESVAKVKKKVFVFMGVERDDGFGFSVKLPRSAEGVLQLPFAEPTGYGLGKSGWVTCRFDGDDEVPPIEMLASWIEESYRAFATKKLQATLDASPPHAPRVTVRKKTAKKKTAKKKTTKKKTTKKPRP